MTKSKIQLIGIGLLFLLNGGCNSSPDSSQSLVKNSDAIRMRVEYWPVDTTTSVGDTIVHLPDAYRLRWVTSSLNDSAVIDKAQDEQGKFLIAAHNHQTKLQAWHEGNSIFTSVLTKQLIGSQKKLAEYSWHNIAYQRYQNGCFIFRTWMSIPDSDVGQAAEVAIDKKGKYRSIKLLQERTAE
jgi:hypothetical protein